MSELYPLMFYVCKFEKFDQLKLICDSIFILITNLVFTDTVGNYETNYKLYVYSNISYIIFKM